MSRSALTLAGLATGVWLALTAVPGVARAAPPVVALIDGELMETTPSGAVSRRVIPNAAVLPIRPRHLTSSCQRTELAEEESSGSQIEPGALDDGQSLLFAAAITVESSVAAAREAAPGEIGEVDLDVVDGDIVFIVDVGNKDVYVDAETGAVLSVNGEDQD